ncbi:TonB-dependent receptor family protein [Pseudomonas sp. DWRC2-2]|uniref:TonB-dependent receptor family protein n=1 Tax=Pseudomonas sp. DWRC2-2 TaxID=2804567 RepID=UPI003CF9FA5D
MHWTTSTVFRHSSLYAVSSVLLAVTPLSSAADASLNDDIRLGTVIVQALKQAPAIAAQAKLDEVAGGTSLVSQAEVEKGRSATLEDTMAYQPGIYAQAVGGNDGVKISIRGSGSTTPPGYFREGIKFLFDGLALTGAGGTPYELLDTQGLDYTEVLRGANAFEYGALTLGGAVNFVTKSGLTSPGSRIKVEGGSFGWQKQAFSTGGVVENADYFVSVDNTIRDGYQDFTFTKAKGVVSNFGYRFNPKLETRLYIRYREEHHEISGALTRAQLKKNSSQTNPTTLATRSDSTKFGSTWIGSKTTYTFDDDATLEAGLVYHNYPQVLARHSPVNPSYWDWRDINYSLKYSRTDQVLGLSSISTVGWSSTQHIRSGVRTYKGDKDLGGLQKQAEYDGSFDHVFSLGNDLGLTDSLYFSTGLSAIQIKRNVNVTYSDRANTSGLPEHYIYDQWKLAPRIGLRYYIAPDVQLFANASRSIDPPSTFSISGSAVTLNYAKPLVPQAANTIEFGIKGRNGIFDGSLAFYKSWIKNELLSVELLPATNTSAAVVTTANSSPTIHQGIEAGLSTRLWEGANGDSLTWRQAYTLNDFRYENDPVFNRNVLPGFPKHLYQGELQYQWANGFYAGVNVQSASSTAADYANSFYAPSYTVWGGRMGYDDPSETWQLYLDLKNLTDQNYATAVLPTYNARGSDVASMYPGDGFGAFAGVTYNF